MKIIISHDVDHLYVQDHFFKDLIIPKLWVRSFIQLCTGKIGIKTFFNRIFCVFSKRQNRIKEVMDLDDKYGIRSSFFFGMRNGLGMSYSHKKVIPYICDVKARGFDVGVHGIEFVDYDEMKKEYNQFQNIIQEDYFGIRMHYVRFDESTFEKLDKCGYLYDTTEFNKKEVEINAPYKVGNLWEFPLHIMDGYVFNDGALENGIEKTKAIIQEAEKKGMPYCTILFHDYLYNEKCYPTGKAWYEWLLGYLKENSYEFISYRKAISELEVNKDERSDGGIVV